MGGTWGTILPAMSDDSLSPEPPVPTYSQRHFERIAAALGVSVTDVQQFKCEFEEAARWYRLNIPPAKRLDGPTLELRNQHPKSKNPERHAKKPKTLSE